MKHHYTLIFTLLLIPVFVFAQKISTFPHTEDCEGTVSWVNTSSFGDDFDWSLNSGSTGSPGTGPDADHTTGAGSYIYTEASSPNNPKNADVLSPIYDLSNYTSANLTFWWYQYGSNGETGDMYVYISTDNMNFNFYYQARWEYYGADSWRQSYIDLTPLAGEDTVRFMIRSSTRNWQSDLALDDIVVNASSAPIVCTEIGSSFTDDFDGDDAWGDGSSWQNNTNFNTGNSSSTFISSLAANGSVGGILMEGSQYSGWDTDIPADGATAFTDNSAHIQTVERNFCNPAGATITLQFDLKQTFYDNANHSWFRLSVNGTPIAEQGGNTYFSPTTNLSDPFQTLTYDLSSYAGSSFTLEFQTCNNYNYSYWDAGGDAAFVDNVSITSSCSYPTGTITGSTTINCGENASLAVAGQEGAAFLQWQWKPSTSSTWVNCNNPMSIMDIYETAYLGEDTDFRIEESFNDETCYANQGLSHTVRTTSCTDVTVWTGQISTVWNANSNWTNGKPNGASTSAFVGNEYANIATFSNGAASTFSDLTVQSDAVLNYTSNQGSDGTITNSFTNHGTINQSGTGWFALIGGSPSSLITNTGDMSTMTIEINGTSGNWKAGSDLTFSNLFLSGGILDISNKTLEITGTTTISAGATLDMSAGKLAITGNYTNNGSITPAAGTLELKGSTNQNVTSNGATYNNIIFNNSSINTAITLLDDMTISGSITLTDGIITTGLNKLISTSTNASDLPIGSSTSFVNGNIRKSIATNTQTYTFPIGKGNKSSDYSPAELTNNNMVGPTRLDISFGEIIEETFNNSDTRITTTHNGGGFINLHEDAVWTITPDAQPTSGSYDLKLSIANVTGLEDNKFTILSRPDASTDYADWATYDGSTSIPNNGQLGRTVSGGYAIKYGFTTFSQKAPASGSDPLPIELINFSALQNGFHVDLTWTTESEVNNDYFSIERSINGIAFETILEVAGAGTSNERIEYKTQDNNPIAGISYYRLKQTDFDGEFSYSKIVAINRVDKDKISIWPNPATDKIYLPIDLNQSTDYLSVYKVNILNAKGQLVYSENFTATSNVRAINISNLDCGIYFLSQTSKSGISHAKFIKK